MGTYFIPGTSSTPVTVPVDTGNTNIDQGIVATCQALYNVDPSNTTSSLPSNCYLLIPIASPPNPANQANIVTIACFRIYDGQGTQKWRGFLTSISPSTCSYGVYRPTWTWGNRFDETQVLLTN
jgi:hypothetical protein